MILIFSYIHLSSLNTPYITFMQLKFNKFFKRNKIKYDLL
nr:MAG TPA: hypothetical protein [Caudoviricetes sp.]